MIRFILLFASFLFVSVFTFGQGNFLGTTQNGGLGGIGEIFIANSDGTGVQILKTLTGDKESTGNYPSELIQSTNGKIYGISTDGGASNLGTLFEFDAATNSVLKKIDFSKDKELAHPFGNLIQASNGKLYGLTSGVYRNTTLISSGIFEYDPTNNKITKKTIVGTNKGNLLLGSNGKLYFYGSGSIMEFDIQSESFVTVVLLPSDLTEYSWRGLSQDGNGRFYGIAEHGGVNNHGAIFEFDPIAGSTIKKFEFTDKTKGILPAGRMVLAANGKFYGVTINGGSSDRGVLFEFDPSNNTYTKKIDFADNNLSATPFSNLSIGRNGKLYGMTFYGGMGPGNIFEYDPISQSYRDLYSFQGIDGGSPILNTLLQSTNGLLYGVTSGRGKFDAGVLFQFDLATGIYKKLVDFSGINNGSSIIGGLSQSSATKKFYGMTSLGGRYNKGVLFEFDPLSNTYLKKIDFDGIASATYSGYGLHKQLTESSNGKFYWFGYSDGGTALYEYVPTSNSLIKKIELPNNDAANNGYDLIRYIVSAKNGTLYFSTLQGGKNGLGALLEYDPISGTLTKKLDFSRDLTGYGIGAIIQHTNGKLYRAVSSGGSHNHGVLLEYDPTSGNITRKVDIIEESNNSEFSLTQGADGKIYGMVPSGGTKQSGFIIEYDIATNTYRKVLDFDSIFNLTKLVTASNGKLFGLCSISDVKMFEFDPSNMISILKPAFDNYLQGYSLNFFNDLKAPQSITFNTLASKTFGDASFVLSASASSKLPITYTSSDPTVASVNGNTILILKAGSTAITASQLGDESYQAAAEVQQVLTVSKAQQQITFGALPDKTIGDGPFTLTATVNSTLPVSYSTTSDKVGIASGIVSLLKPGRVDITANQSGNENYNAAASISQSFCIKPLRPTITLSGLNTATPTLTSSASTGNQWYSGTTQLTGENNNVFVIKTSGTYKVLVKADDCLSEFSLDQNLIITGDIPTTSESLLVYPNPATSILTIDLGNEDGKKEVAIFDLLGRSIFSQHTEGKKTEIDVSEYTRGLYIIKVQTTLRKSILRFEKQ